MIQTPLYGPFTTPTFSSTTTSTTGYPYTQNARSEFLMHVYGREILCAKVSGRLIKGTTGDEHGNITILLTVGHNEEDYEAFLHSLDFHYSVDRYSNTAFSGIIWYKDMTWSTRENYDMEEWVYHNVPEIPFELWRKQNIGGE